MDIRAILANQSGPAVLAEGTDADGRPTDDLSEVVDGGLLVPQSDGTTAYVPLRRMVELGVTVSIRP
jgi:hypothetical protein